jgi:hypothetical protein
VALVTAAAGGAAAAAVAAGAVVAAGAAEVAAAAAAGAGAAAGAAAAGAWCRHPALLRLQAQREPDVPALPGGGRQPAGGATLWPHLLPRLPAGGARGRSVVPDLSRRGRRRGSLAWRCW